MHHMLYPLILTMQEWSTVTSPRLGIEHISERIYWGKCYPESELQQAIITFIEKREAIYFLYQNFNLFDTISQT